MQFFFHMSTPAIFQCLLHSISERWNGISRNEEGRQIEEVKEYFVAITEKYERKKNIREKGENLWGFEY